MVQIGNTGFTATSDIAARMNAFKSEHDLSDEQFFAVLALADTDGSRTIASDTFELVGNGDRVITKAEFEKLSAVLSSLVEADNGINTVSEAIKAITARKIPHANFNGIQSFFSVVEKIDFAQIITDQLQFAVDKAKENRKNVVELNFAVFSFDYVEIIDFLKKALKENSNLCVNIVTDISDSNSTAPLRKLYEEFKNSGQIQLRYKLNNGWTIKDWSAGRPAYDHASIKARGYGLEHQKGFQIVVNGEVARMVTGTANLSKTAFTNNFEDISIISPTTPANYILTRSWQAEFSAKMNHEHYLPVAAAKRFEGLVIAILRNAYAKFKDGTYDQEQAEKEISVKMKDLMDHAMAYAYGQKHETDKKEPKKILQGSYIPYHEKILDPETFPADIVRKYGPDLHNINVNIITPETEKVMRALVQISFPETRDNQSKTNAVINKWKELLQNDNLNSGIWSINELIEAIAYALNVLPDSLTQENGQLRKLWESILTTPDQFVKDNPGLQEHFDLVGAFRKVNVNRIETEKELTDNIQGIPQSLAKAIIELRNKNGFIDGSEDLIQLLKQKNMQEWYVTLCDRLDFSYTHFSFSSNIDRTPGHGYSFAANAPGDFSPAIVSTLQSSDRVESTTTDYGALEILNFAKKDDIVDFVYFGVSMNTKIWGAFTSALERGVKFNIIFDGTYNKDAVEAIKNKMKAQPELKKNINLISTSRTMHRKTVVLRAVSDGHGKYTQGNAVSTGSANASGTAATMNAEDNMYLRNVDGVVEQFILGTNLLMAKNKRMVVHYGFCNSDFVDFKDAARKVIPEVLKDFEA